MIRIPPPPFGKWKLTASSVGGRCVNSEALLQDCITFILEIVGEDGYGFQELRYSWDTGTISSATEEYENLLYAANQLISLANKHWPDFDPLTMSGLRSVLGNEEDVYDVVFIRE